MDDRLFRNAMGRFATGITVITTEMENEIHGMTANAFMSVSLNPKLVLVSIANKAKMCNYIRQTQKYAVSFLTADQQEISMQFAGQIKEERSYEFARFHQMPVIKEALCALTCNVVAEHEAGDHTLFIGEVTEIDIKEGDPLLFFQGKYRHMEPIDETIS
jgi:flavin reductase (DIM6/NTAB) family NADH-FMN oxidoreductase RutF